MTEEEENKNEASEEPLTLAQIEEALNQAMEPMKKTQLQMNNKVDSLDESMRKLDKKMSRVVEALPLADEYPQVAIAASENDYNHARKTGGSATWTLVSYENSSALIGSLHCLQKVKKKHVRDEQNKSILAFTLPRRLSSYLQEKKVTVNSIGIPTGFVANSFKIQLKHDICVMKLATSGCLPSEELTADEGLSRHSEFDNGRVVGTSLSGKVHGKSLEYWEKEELFSFTADFCEKGNSGTLMFLVGGPDKDSKVKAIGCFQGTLPEKPGRWQRGRIVPIPAPEDLTWLKVKEIVSESVSDQPNEVAGESRVSTEERYFLMAEYDGMLSFDQRSLFPEGNTSASTFEELEHEADEMYELVDLPVPDADFDDACDY